MQYSPSQLKERLLESIDSEYNRHQEPYHNTYTGLRISTRSIERQDSGDSGYDPMTPPVDKVDKMEKLMIVRPDGYAMATMQNGNCDMFNSSQSINSLHEMEDTNSLIFDMRNRTTEPGTTFPPVNNVVNTVHETRMKALAADKTAKTLKSKTHNDNTSVKTATITVNKDYGIGEGYSKATLFVSNEREDSVKSSNTSNTSVTEVNISPSINNNDLSSASDYVTASKHDSVVSESGEKISNSSMLRQDNVDGNVKNEAPSEGFDMSNICQLDTIPHPVMDSGGSDSISFEAYSCSDLKGSLFDNNRKQNKTQENNTTQPTDAYVSHGCSVGSNSLLDGTDTSPGFDSFPNSGPIVSSSLELPSAAPAASLADESLAVAPTFTSPKPSEQFSLPQLNSIPTPSSIAFSEGDQYVYTSSGEDERTILYTGKDKPHVKSDCSGSFSLLQDAGGQGYVSAPNNLQASALSHTTTNLNSSPSNKQESLTSVVCQHTLAANPAEQGYVTSETCQQAVRSNPIPAEQRYVTSETCQQAPVANPIPAAQRYVTSETCLQAPVANSIPTNQEYVMPETCQQDQVANPQNSDDAGGLSSCSGDPAYVSHPPELLASFSGQEREGLNVGTSSYVDQTFAQREEPNSELNRFSDSRGGCIPSSLPGSGGYVDKTFALSQNISPKDNPISFEEQSKRNNCITQPVEFGHSVKTLAVQDKNLNETHNDMPPSGPTPSPQSNNNIGYVDQTVLSQQPWHVIPHSAVTQQPPPMGPQITVSDPKLSNGYVDESFLKLAQGNKVKCSQGMNLSLQIGNRDRQENEGEERSEKDSDSGLSSMEQRSPETEEKQQDVFVQK